MPLKDNYQPGDLFGHADLNAMAGQVNALTDAPIQQKLYRVDDFGADPTGATFSDAAVAAARTAMGDDPGVLVFGIGEYRLSAGLNLENGTSFGLYQGVRGQGAGATRIVYTGEDACFEFRNLDWEFNTASEPSGGIHGMWIYGWENTNSNTYGIRYGDIGRMRVSDVHIAGFNQPGCAGLFGDNHVAWSERGDIECSVEQCTTAFLFQGCMPNSLQSYGSSFDYSKYRLTFVVMPNQDAFVLRSLPGGMKTNMNGVDLALTGNCNNAPPGGTNTGTLFKVGRDNEDGAALSGELHVNVETSGYVDGVTHFDFSMGDGPFWEVQSRVSAFGSINLIPFSGTNFRAGTATTRTFAFAGLLKKSPAFGSTTNSQAFQPLQLLSQARGEYWISPTNAVQMVYLVEATVGTFRLNYDGDLTDPIPYDASVAAVQAALDEIPGLAGNVTVVGAQPRFVNGYYNDETAYGITFGEALAETDVPTFTVDDSALTGTAKVVVRRTGSENKTLVARIETGNIIKIEETPGVYRLGLDIGALTDQVGVDRDSPFGLTAVDIWIKQPTTGGNVVLEGPWFTPNALSASTYTFEWFDGIPPVLSTEPDKLDVIRLSTYNFNSWVGQHVTKVVTTPAGSQTLTNKAISLASNTVTGTLSQFNAALTDGDFATLTGAETLVNKTLTSPTITSPTGNIVTSIDGASGAVTGIARRVATTSYTGAATNQWTKVLTWTASVAYYSQSLLLTFVSTPGIAATATVLVQFTNNTAGANPTGSVYITSLGCDPNRIDDNAFKLVGGAYGEPIELWLKQKSYTAFDVYETARYNNGGTLTYLTAAGLQGTEPVGSVINVSTNGVVAGNAPVVTTTATQTLTGKTLTAPVLSGTVTGTYTLGGTPTFPSTVVTTTDAQTLTNKTLTSPRMGTILDTNGATGLVIQPTAGAVNYPKIWNDSTTWVAYGVDGSSANINLQILPKGDGTVNIYSGGASAGYIARFNKPGSGTPVNYIVFTSAADGGAPKITGAGPGTDVSLNLGTQGAGTVQANGVPVVTTTGTQALTNKTLTSPTITNPTITGTPFIQRSISNVTAPAVLGSAAATDYVAFSKMTEPVALLNCEGSNNSTTFTDSGYLAANWTASGDAKISTAQSKWGNGSAYFDGTGDYIAPTADSSNFAFGANDFTIEMWVRPAVVTGGSWILYDARPLSTNGAYPMLYIATDASIRYYANSADRCASGAGTLTVNTWYHIALVRNSGTTKLYLDGTQVGSSYTDASAYLGAASRPVMGTNGGTAGIGWYIGYMQDIRIFNGVGLYTSTFTPPSRLGRSYEDVSTADKTVALLHGNGANASTTMTDSGVLRSDWTAAGNAQISTAQSKYGGSSIYLDGTGDYLTATSPSSMAFGTGDFTMEGWFRFDSVTAGTLFDLRPAVTNGAYPMLFVGAGALVYLTSATYRITGGSLSTGTWYHIAVARSGTSTKVFLNGTQVGSTWTDTTDYLVGVVRVGANYNPSSYVNGYINDIRITKGLARYTTTFTPPTSLLPDVPVLRLPTAVSNTNRYTVKTVGAQTVLVGAPSGQTIDGAATASVVTGDSNDFVSDGSSWRVV